MARAIDLVGDPWSLLLLSRAILGVRRFQDFAERLDAPPTTLTRKLGELVERGMLETHEYAPQRVEYELTAQGRDFLPVLLAMAAWGSKWLFPDGAPLECTNPTGSARIDPIVVDRRTLTRLHSGSVALRPGPGASTALRRSMPKPVLLATERAS